MTEIDPSANTHRAGSCGLESRRRSGPDAPVGPAARLWGAMLVVVGLWLFATVTLNLDLPAIPIREVWPVALAVAGGFLILGSSRRER